MILTMKLRAGEDLCLPLPRSAGEGALAGAGERAVPFGAKRHKTHETGETLFAHGNLGRKAPKRTTPSLGPAGPLLPPERGRGKPSGGAAPPTKLKEETVTACRRS
jgi:hypothetical protein